MTKERSVYEKNLSPKNDLSYEEYSTEKDRSGKMSFFKRIFQRQESTLWCVTYIDTNTFRRDRVMVILKDAGIEVKPSTDHLLVKQNQYDHAMNVLKEHGY